MDATEDTGNTGTWYCKDREMGRRNSYGTYTLFFPINFDQDSTSIGSEWNETQKAVCVLVLTSVCIYVKVFVCAEEMDGEGLKVEEKKGLVPDIS